jgi:hypothetical protein
VTRDKETNCVKSFTSSKEASDSKFSNAEIEVIGIVGKFLIFIASIEYCLKMPAFSSYIVPYILFFIALFGAFYKLVLTI